jgi:poly-D-alanine transfer protein DltD
MVKGLPDEATFQELNRLADEILKKHRESNIV